jgi:poly(3-hydroxybutyrate) depolymerase
LSSGGAMAATVATLYFDQFAAVGIHSGLPYASARNLSSAIAIMKDGGGGNKAGWGARPLFAQKRKILPTIVFHGDRDTTVHPRNGDQIIAQSLSSFRSDTGLLSGRTAEAILTQGKIPGGHDYTRSIHTDSHGRAVAEHWIVHGAGHVWSGGSRFGSFTDARGPDAGEEMLRFFLERP